MGQKYLGITGPLGSGKSEIAKGVSDHLVTHRSWGVAVVPFAMPLKKLATDMGWDGKKDDKGRRLLQLLGTECMRECIAEDGWVRMWHKHVMGLPVFTDLVIADDIRFDNEAKLIRDLGGKVIYVSARDEIRELRGADLSHSGHASEAGVSDDLIDHIVDNGNDIKQAVEDVLKVVYRM